jgi:hypothetical protein
MLDIVAAFAGGVMYAMDVVVLVGLAQISPRSKLLAFLLAAVWAAMIPLLTAGGAFEPATLGVLPVPPVLFGILVVIGIVAWLSWSAFRTALLSVPLAALVAIHGFRIGGVLFLMLWARGRLAAPFAPSAGWGDIITGAVAIPLAAMVAVGRMPSKAVLSIWNAFGALDLFVAVTLAFFSAPGTPFRIFMEPPGTAVMRTFPWSGVATMLVPLYLLAHLTIAVRLRPMRVERPGARAPTQSGGVTPSARSI